LEINGIYCENYIVTFKHSVVTMKSFLILQQVVHIFTTVLQVVKHRKSTPFQSSPVKISETRLSTSVVLILNITTGGTYIYHCAPSG